MNDIDEIFFLNTTKAPKNQCLEKIRNHVRRLQSEKSEN